MPTIDNRDCLHLLGSARQRRAKVRPPKLGLAERALRRYTSKKIYASFQLYRGPGGVSRLAVHAIRTSWG